MSRSPIAPEEWTDPRHRAGLQAEIDVGECLRVAGWQIEAHRFKLGHNDLDLIARRGSLVAFVEVKARRSTKFGDGAEAVSRRKRQTIERVAWWWIVRRGKPGDQYRFDVAVVGLSDTEGPSIRWIEDAWRPGWR